MRKNRKMRTSEMRNIRNHKNQRLISRRVKGKLKRDRYLKMMQKQAKNMI